MQILSKTELGKYKQVSQAGKESIDSRDDADDGGYFDIND
jgi:hypothetical protein